MPDAFATEPAVHRHPVVPARYTNAHAFRHIRAMSHVAGIVQVGIRSLRSSQVMLEDSVRDGNAVVTMREFRGRGFPAVLAAVPEGARCYVSIDIDVLDQPRWKAART